MRSVLSVLTIVVCVCFFVGCAQMSGRTGSRPGEAAADQLAPVDMVSAEIRLHDDMLRLEAISSQLHKQAKEMALLRKEMHRYERGYYTSDEHDRIESLLFRYVACRSSLWDMIDYYSDYEKHFADDLSRAKGFLIGFCAAAHLLNYSSLVVHTFMDSPAVKAKLNEEFHRSGISRGTFDELFNSVTSVENIKKAKAAWLLFSAELADEESALSRAAGSGKEYGKLVELTRTLYLASDARVTDILEKNALLLPQVKNVLIHSSIVGYAKKMKEQMGDNLSATKAILFVNVSRLRSPVARAFRMTDEQIRQLREIMEPGDLVLTFSDGYMSNVFLPGAFKHGITYVGTAAERAAAGIADSCFADVKRAAARQKAAADAGYQYLPNGRHADLVEAVAEGVIFNSLEVITDVHISRLLVLRPRLSEAERIRQLKTVFLLLGDTYDFEFDFDDGTHQCCTEVIYRSLNGVGPVRFGLTRRMGVMTLSADDIINYYLSSGVGALDFVLLVESAGGQKKDEAVILTGIKGAKRCREIMGQ